MCNAHVHALHIFRRKSYFYTVWNTLVAEQIVVLSCSCAADIRNCSYLSGTDDTVVAEGGLVSDWSQLCLKEHEWSRDSYGILNRRTTRQRRNIVATAQFKKKKKKEEGKFLRHFSPRDTIIDAYGNFTSPRRLIPPVYFPRRRVLRRTCL